MTRPSAKLLTSNVTRVAEHKPWASHSPQLGLATRHTRRLRVVLRMIVGLGLTVIAFAVAGRRVWWLKRLAFTGQPAPERLEYAREHPRDRPGDAADRGDRAAQAAEVDGAGHGARGHVLGLHRPAADDHRGVRRAVLADVRDPGDRALGGDRVHRGPVRRRGPGRHHHLHGHPAPQQPAQGGPRLAVLRLPHPRRLGRARDDHRGHHHAADLPGRAGEHRGVPLRERRRLAVRVLGGRQVAAPSRLRGQQRPRGRVHPGSARGDHGVPGRRVLLQAPAHLPGPAERAVLPPPERARPA